MSPNSDSEQCTESKLSRVHQVHTLGLACRRAPCRSLPGRVACTADRIVVVSSPVSQPVSRYNPAAKPPSCHDTTDCIVTSLSGQAALLSRYNLLYRDIPIPVRPRARALPHSPACGRPCRGPSWPCRGLYCGPTMPCRGHGLAISWPCPGCAQASLPNPVSRYNPLYRDSNWQ